MADTTTARLFHVGDRVYATAFTDCFGKHVPARGPLVVAEETAERFFCSLNGRAPHYRIKANEPNGRGYVEGAERFFASEADYLDREHSDQRAVATGALTWR